MDQFTGYAIEEEDREELLQTQVDAVMYALTELPDRMDPRSSPLADQGFIRVENQQSVGACQGFSLACSAEFAHTFATGEVVQLDNMYAYIASQEKDGINGDQGSTLSGGTKAARDGLRKETEPYRPVYPGRAYLTPARRADAVYKLMSHTIMRSADQIKQFIGSAVGIVQIGIPWGSFMTPDSRGCIREFRPTGRPGGHAVVFCGYVPDSDVGVSSGSGWWALMKNSWSMRWGIRGYAFVAPRAIDQMLRHQWTVMVGRSDMQSPRSRRSKFDFTKRSILR
jgi:hypothetical protein